MAAIVEAEPGCGVGAGINVGLVGNNATGGSNTGRMFIELKPRDSARRRSTRSSPRLRPKLAQVPGIRAFPSTRRRSTWAAAAAARIYQFTMQDTDTAELYRVGAGARGAGAADARASRT